VPFTIAFVPGVTLTRWATAWEERRRDVQLAFVPTDDPVSALREGTADVAFLRLPVDREGLSIIPLYEEQAVVVVPKDHPIADLASVTLGELEAEDRAVGAPADAVELVAVGGGIVILPHSIARMHLRKDVVSRPVSDAESTTVALAWPEARTTEDVEEWVGIVRGRTANSSRALVPGEPKKTAAPRQKRPAPAAKKTKFPNKKGR
jgi:DNA-binding transcriptional LysR family regulator